jgi:hypothetical protein
MAKGGETKLEAVAMSTTEKALDIMHEAGILCCMLLFVITGGMLSMRYANDGDFLPLLTGFVCMAIGATVMLRTPGRFRKWAAIREGSGADYEDENEAYDESLVRLGR